MIELQGLTRRFGDQMAVDRLDFKVEAGELFGLVGPDGAGKTTTLRMLAGVLKPTAGDAVVAGCSVVREAERAKLSLAYMSQRFGLYADLTVLENLHFYADLYRVPHDERSRRMERLFTFSRLGPFRDRLAGQLSGGMKQKLGLSCALIHEPRVLLLDEPTFGVDPVSRRELWLIVHEMVERGVTALVSTSYMDEAERFDRLALLDLGRLLALDTPQHLTSSFGADLLEVRVEETRRASHLLQGLPGVRRASVFGDRLHLTVESAGRDAPAVAEALRGAGIAAAPPVRVAASIEDVFIRRIAESRSAEHAG
jgi:drug efflux transport system ATP-binding protein